MIIFILCIALLLLSKMHISKNIHHDYLSHDHTLVINGVFVLLVLLSHCFANVTHINEFLDLPYQSIQYHLDQAIVIPFLMFSGYGICLSMTKKKDYIKTLLTKRLPQLLIHFDIAVVIYLILSNFLGNAYSVGHILLALIGFTSVGNSNWYIFVMLLLYVFICAGHLISSKKAKPSFILVCLVVLSCAYMVIMRLMNIPAYYFNTILTFSLGFGYALIKDKIDQYLVNQPFVYYILFAFVILAYGILSPMKNNSFVFYEIWTFLFALLLLLVMMKIRFNHPFLRYCGQNVFSIYILQRIPIHLLVHYGLNSNALVLVIITFISTLFFTNIFNRLLSRVDKLIFK